MIMQNPANRNDKPTITLRQNLNYSIGSCIDIDDFNFSLFDNICHNFAHSRGFDLSFHKVRQI